MTSRFRTLRIVAAMTLAFVAWFATARCGGGNTSAPTVNIPPPTGPVNTGPTGPTGPIFGDQTLVGAGDIGYPDSVGNAQTARLVQGIGGQVFTAGDNAYPNGTADDFAKWYAPTWGQFLFRTRPVPGNHEYQEDPSAQAYYNYFGTLAGTPGQGYYYYDVGAWHIVALNSLIDVSEFGMQGQWLKTDLASTDKKCVLAIWHFPLYTSGPDGPSPQMRDFWRILYRYHAEIIVNGHEHLYERFSPQTPDGALDIANGIHEYIVGTGGAIQYDFQGMRSNSAAQISHRFGVINFTLKNSGWQSTFIDTSGAQSDPVTGTCHAR